MLHNTFVVQTIYGTTIFTSSPYASIGVAGATLFPTENAAREAAETFLQQEQAAGLMAFLTSKVVL
jgi:hypothetical protein